MCSGQQVTLMMGMTNSSYAHLPNYADELRISSINCRPESLGFEV